MSSRLQSILSGADCAVAIASDFDMPKSASLGFLAKMTGTPLGTLSILEQNPDGSFNTLLSQLFSGTGFKWGGFVPQRRSSVLRIQYAPTNQVQKTTLTLGGALVASNVVSIKVNGTTYSVTYASSSDATLQALATAIAADPSVASAVVTVVGGNQTGSDDRVITITFIDNESYAVNTPSITSGASQTTLTVVQTQNPSSGSLDFDLIVQEQ
jgi:hypothetical protein